MYHVKVVPRHNDGPFVQHADDQINDGSEITGAAHEVDGYPIGEAIESYQGFDTCEVYRELLTIDSSTGGEWFVPKDTNGDYIVDAAGRPLGSGIELVYSERPVEQIKVLRFGPFSETQFWRYEFRLRVKAGAADYTVVDQYIYIVDVDNCGDAGAP